MDDTIIQPPNPNLKILVVDDDAMVRSVLVDYLHAFGFRFITEAANGEQALRALRDKSHSIDLILSDWEMPEINGLTVLQAIRKTPERAHIPFIMITSQTPREKQKIEWARKWRVSGYIVKPFRGKILRDKIWSVMGWAELSDTG